MVRFKSLSLLLQQGLPLSCVRHATLLFWKTTSLLWRGLLVAVAGLLAVPLTHLSRSLMGKQGGAVGLALSLPK
jgi:hypothetical protein